MARSQTLLSPNISGREILKGMKMAFRIQTHTKYPVVVGVTREGGRD